MQLPPLTRGRIIRRYKRFLADIELASGEVVTAHCPNTGSMQGCWEPGAPVELSYSDNPKRKLAWTLERVDMGQGWIGVNTARPNAVVAEAIMEGRVESLAGYSSLRREVKYDVAGLHSSRIDLKLEGGDRPDGLVEVKNVTLWDGAALSFPDAVSERALKHLNVLHKAVEHGLRGVIVFALNRPEGEYFTPASHIDPAYASRLEEVLSQGVEGVALRIRHSADGMIGDGIVPIRFI
jgi:sugar fermentation stimulation protein A